MRKKEAWMKLGAKVKVWNGRMGTITKIEEGRRDGVDIYYIDVRLVGAINSNTYPADHISGLVKEAQS